MKTAKFNIFLIEFDIVRRCVEGSAQPETCTAYLSPRIP